jgi:hypothetical protein
VSTPNKYTPANNTEPQPVLIPPNCPHCGKPLADMGCHQWLLEMTGGQLAMVVAAYCPNESCRKVLSAQTMIVQKPGQAERAAIVPPN